MKITMTFNTNLKIFNEKSTLYPLPSLVFFWAGPSSNMAALDSN